MGFFDRFFKRKKKERSLLDLIDEAGLELEVSIKPVDLSKELDKNNKD
tara:strand:+ start:640 stop:783 length:144 start_codon:yes stop_codon:yes gene_type:complete